MKKEYLLSLVHEVKEELNMVNCDKDVVIKSTGLIVSSMIISDCLEEVVKNLLKKE